MKKFALKAALPLLLSLIAGCALFSDSSGGDSLLLYYIADNGVSGSTEVIVSEERVVDTGGNPVRSLMNAYFDGPENSEYASPFPQGTSAVKWDTVNGTLVVTLSEEYEKLKGIDKSIAKSCLALTLCGLDNIESVAVLAEDEAYTSSTETLSAESILLAEDSEKEEEGQIRLYFADLSSRYVVAETRSTVVSEYESLESYVVEQLIAGPLSDELQPVMPEGTKLLSVYVESSVCYVNLSAEFMDNMPQTEAGERMTIYSIVNSLTEIEGIEAVQILIEGSKTDFYKYMEIGQPIKRNESAISPGYVYAGIVDITIYVKSWSPDHLAAMPILTEPESKDTLAETVVKTLIGWQAIEGYSNPIPEGTSLLNIEFSDDTCYVDLSREFIDNNLSGYYEECLSVNAIVASLTDLDGIDKVQILIEGQVTDHKHYKMSQPLGEPTDMLYS